MRTRSLSAAGLLALALSTVNGGAQANTISISTNGDPTVRATLSDGTLNNTLLGFIGIGSTSSTKAYTFDLANSGEQTEIDFANSYAGTSFTSVDFSKTSFNTDPPVTFTVNSPYFELKVGGGGGGNLHALFENLSGGPLTLTYEKITGRGFQGYGLSHVSELGSLSPVPLPASAPMFGAALLGLAGVGFLAKRKKAAAAA